MKNDTAFTRREFIQTGLMVVSAMSSVPTFLQRSALALETQKDARVKDTPGVPGDRILVVVQLSGGNDGLNTVIPWGMDGYYKARPALAVTRDKVLSLGKNSDIGLHPDMADYKALLEEGIANIVQGVGYPNPNRSHFASMDIWHTANPQGGKGLGWVGKAMDQTYAPGGKVTNSDAATACVCIGNEAPLATEGKHIKPITFANPGAFRWAGADVSEGLQAAYQRIHQPGAMAEIPRDDSQAAFVLRTAMDAQVVSERVRTAVAQKPLTNFAGGTLANQLKMVAAMIRAELPTRVYYVGLGGFDTHAGQAGRHGGLLRTFAGAMKSFAAELKAMGQQERVLTMAFSEFGRRVEQNASQGTDHGTAGPMFLMGPMVRAGVVGEHPSLEKSRLVDGDMVFNVDFRSVYAAVLGQWMRIDPAKVIGASLRPAGVMSAGWLKANGV